jgi:hypothetical protein
MDLVASISESEGRQGRESELQGWRREKKLNLLLDFGDRVYPAAAKTATSG